MDVVDGFKSHSRGHRKTLEFGIFKKPHTSIGTHLVISAVLAAYLYCKFIHFVLVQQGARSAFTSRAKSPGCRRKASAGVCAMLKLDDLAIFAVRWQH